MGKIADKQDVKIELLKPYERNSKVHNKDQIEKIKRSISEFGFLSPCLIDENYNIIAGHGRVMAAKELNMETVPCVFIEGLSENQRRAYIIADNKLTELGGWDDEILEDELRSLYTNGFDIDVTGFDFDFGEEENEEPKIEDPQMNPTLVLPESRIFVFAVSAFGTNSERFIEIQLSPEEAEHLLKRVDELQVSEVASKLRGAINDL